MRPDLWLLPHETAESTKLLLADLFRLALHYTPICEALEDSLSDRILERLCHLMVAHFLKILSRVGLQLSDNFIVVILLLKVESGPFGLEKCLQCRSAAELVRCSRCRFALFGQILTFLQHARITDQAAPVEGDRAAALGKPVRSCHFGSRPCGYFPLC